jgi:hypothetical protein
MDVMNYSHGIVWTLIYGNYGVSQHLAHKLGLPICMNYNGKAR